MPRFNHPTAAYLLPFLTLVAVALLTGLTSASLDLLYGVRIFAVVFVLLAFRRYYRGLAEVVSWSAVVAGLLAAAAFIGLSSRPDAESMRIWHEEWQALPSWSRHWWTLVRAFGSILVVPVAEELAFRGYLLRRLSAPEFDTVSPGHVSVSALLISSAAFGAIHAGWLGASIAGLLFGIVQMRSNSIKQAIWAHACSNAAVAVYVVGFGEWWLWM